MNQVKLKTLEGFEIPKLVYLTGNRDAATRQSGEIEEIQSNLINNNFDVLTESDLGDYLDFHFGDCQVYF